MDSVTDLAKLILKNSKKNAGTDATATVLRVEDDIAYVHIDGGATETPAQMSISCKTGDTVKIRINNGRCWITGNTTAPPTDDTEAKKKVGQDKVILAINESKETATIKAEKISLEGTVTANNNVVIDKSGRITCKNATIEGDVTATTGTIGCFTVNEDGTITAETDDSRLTFSNSSLVIDSGKRAEDDYANHVKVSPGGVAIGYADGVELSGPSSDSSIRAIFYGNIVANNMPQISNTVSATKGGTWDVNTSIYVGSITLAERGSYIVVAGLQFTNKTQSAQVYMGLTTLGYLDTTLPSCTCVGYISGVNVRLTTTLIIDTESDNVNLNLYAYCRGGTMTLGTYDITAFSIAPYVWS